MGIFRDREVYGFMYSSGVGVAGDEGGRPVGRRQVIGWVAGTSLVGAAVVQNERRRTAEYTNANLQKFHEEFGLVFEEDTDVSDSRLGILVRQLRSLPEGLRTSFDEQVSLGFTKHELLLSDIKPDFTVMLRLVQSRNPLLRSVGVHEYQFSEADLVRGLVKKKVLQDRLRSPQGKSVNESLREIIGRDYPVKIRSGLPFSGSTQDLVPPVPLSVAGRDTLGQVVPFDTSRTYGVVASFLAPPANYGMARLMGDLSAAYVSGREAFGEAVKGLPGAVAVNGLYQLFKDDIFEGQEYESPYVLKTA